MEDHNPQFFIFVSEGSGFAVGNVAYWIGVIIVNQTTPFIVFFIKLHGFFYILSGVNFLAFFFVLFILPETKVSCSFVSIHCSLFSFLRV